ncbi:MAG: hypothetical protein F6K31_43920 [Symploca sp. SIO2G7]|nr:hypothetical protein [Symploca sp. SIO2G7]
MELPMQDAQEKTTETLLTEINAEESATVNGGYCGYARPVNYGYRHNCYYPRKRYYSRPVYYGNRYGCY